MRRLLDIELLWMLLVSMTRQLWHLLITASWKVLSPYKEVGGLSSFIFNKEHSITINIIIYHALLEISLALSCKSEKPSLVIVCIFLQVQKGIIHDTQERLFNLKMEKYGVISCVYIIGKNNVFKYRSFCLTYIIGTES